MAWASWAGLKTGKVLSQVTQLTLESLVLLLERKDLLRQGANSVL